MNVVIYTCFVGVIVDETKLVRCVDVKPTKEDLCGLIFTFNDINFHNSKIIAIWYDLSMRSCRLCAIDMNELSDIDNYVDFDLTILPKGNLFVWAKGMGMTRMQTYNSIQINDCEFKTIFGELLPYDELEKCDGTLRQNTIDEMNMLLVRSEKYNYKFSVIGLAKVMMTTFFADGSFYDSLDIVRYQNLPIPGKMKIKAENNGVETELYCYFDFDNMKKFLSRFYGKHRNTKTDFIIRIDVENKKYELALYRQGLKEPVVIPESAYQLIVFKNKFEDYRSENYDQPRGAWIW